MGFLRNLIPSLLHLLVMFLGLASTQENPSEGFNVTERDALLALKADFNNPFLNKNWYGGHCYANSPSLWHGIRCLNGRVVGIAMESLGLTGKVDAHALFNLPELSSLSFRNNSMSGNVMDFSFNKKLMSIDLSENMFDGPISESLLGLDVLQSLQLQGNNLTGHIPRFSQPSLTTFNVSDNKLSGEIPQTHMLQSFEFSSYSNNTSLCGPPSPSKCNYSSEAEKADTTLFSGIKLVVFIVVDIVVIVVLVVAFILYKKAKNKKKEKKENEDEEEMKSKTEKIEHKEERRQLTFMNEARGFELGDLFKASAEGLGKGNFSNTYKATLDNGVEVVVKRLKDVKPLTGEEFTKHMKVLADLKHPNLLPLLAYHYSNDEKLLVYKHVRRGNLFYRLHGERGKNRIPFKWNSRLLVAQSIARGMEFLHHNTISQTNAPHPHGNLKSSNVLLIENDMAVVADFGLEPLIALPIATQHMSSYKSPEFQHRKKLSKKSDIWTLGCVLLELVTGKISSCSGNKDAQGIDLCTWVHTAVREEWTGEIFDSEISSHRNAGAGMLQLLQIALKCCDKVPEKRPDIEQVVREIHKIKTCDSEEDSDFSYELSYDSFSAGSGSFAG